MFQKKHNTHREVLDLQLGVSSWVGMVEFSLDAGALDLLLITQICDQQIHRAWTETSFLGLKK